MKPIRVAFVLLHFDPGGLERITLNLLRRLDRSRFAPMLVLIHRAGALCERLPDDVPVVVLGARARGAVRPLARSLSSHQVDVVFSGTVPGNVIAVAAAAISRGRLRVVVNEHTPPSLLLAAVDRPRCYLAAMRWAYPRAARVAVPLAALGDELRQVLRRPRLNVVELPNLVFDDDLSELAAEEPEIPLPAAPLILAAGRLETAKGFDLLIEALADIEVTPAPHLLLLGEGPQRDELAEQAHRLGIAERVHLPGLVANPHPYFRRADVVVVPSRREALPNVLVEAMAHGRAVVATDCWDGPRELLDHGEAGLLVPVEDAPALAAAVARLLEDEALAERLRQRGRERAQRFHAARTLPAAEALIEEVAVG